MPGVRFTKENLLEKAKLEANWYKLNVKGFEEKVSKGGDSQNFIGSFVIAEGPMAGTPIRLYFNEQVMGRITDYIGCFVGNLETIVGKEVIDMMTQTVGKQVMGYARYDPEFKWNTIEDFKRVS